MDENEFMKAFSGIDLLAVGAVSQTIGTVVAKLYIGMIEGGMSAESSERLIGQAFDIFLRHLAQMQQPPRAQQ